MKFKVIKIVLVNIVYAVLFSGCSGGEIHKMAAKIALRQFRSLHFRVNDNPLGSDDLCFTNFSDKDIVKIEHSMAMSVMIRNGKFLQYSNGRFATGVPRFISGDQYFIKDLSRGFDYSWHSGLMLGHNYQKDFHFSDWVVCIDKMIRKGESKYLFGEFKFDKNFDKIENAFQGDIYRFRVTFSDGTYKEIYCWPWDEKPVWELCRSGRYLKKK